MAIRPQRRGGAASQTHHIPPLHGPVSGDSARLTKAKQPLPYLGAVAIYKKRRAAQRQRWQSLPSGQIQHFAFRAPSPGSRIPTQSQLTVHAEPSNLSYSKADRHFLDTPKARILLSACASRVGAEHTAPKYLRKKCHCASWRLRFSFLARTSFNRLNEVSGTVTEHMSSTWSNFCALSSLVTCSFFPLHSMLEHTAGK